MRGRFAALWIVTLLAPPAVAAAQPNPFDPVPQAVATRFADGRTVYSLLKPGGTSSWTPVFPRVPGEETDRHGLPLTALEVAVVPDGLRVSVSVSLIYGRPHQHKIAVATVSLTDDTPARVDQLRDFGVWSIVFSLVPVPPVMALAPAVTSVSPSLDARVELAPGGGQSFVVVVVNQSHRAVRGFRVIADRQGRRAFTGYRRGVRHAPLIQPGEAFTFDVPTSVRPGVDGSPTPAPVDQLSITSVSWDDGTVDGDPEPAASERALAAGSVRQLAQVLVVLREAGDPLRPLAMPELRDRIAALSIDVDPADASEVPATQMKAGMQQVRQLAIADLDAYLKQSEREAPPLWLSQTITAYEQWLERATTVSGKRR
jgi:hypothetical protein